MLSLCHSDEVIPSDELADAAMLAIFNGIIALEGKKSRLADLGINAASFSGALPFSRHMPRPTLI